MRLSINPDDGEPYIEYCKLRDKKYAITLNGIPQPNAIACETGKIGAWVERYVTVDGKPDGELLVMNYQPQTERVYGCVEVIVDAPLTPVWPAAPPMPRPPQCLNCLTTLVCGACPRCAAKSTLPECPSCRYPLTNGQCTNGWCGKYPGNAPANPCGYDTTGNPYHAILEWFLSAAPVEPLLGSLHEHIDGQKS